MLRGPVTPEADTLGVSREIGAALDGTLRGRLTAEDITVFKSLGNAAQDICLAEEALRLAGPGVPSFDPTA